MTTMIARIIHTSIARDWREVYAFMADHEKMPLWASGLSSGLTRDGDEWIAPGPLGTARVRFAPDNEFGVIDHLVTLDNGLEVHNALRVVPNGDGAEVMFTLLRQPNMSDEQFAADAAWVEKDLATLKSILESDSDKRNDGKKHGQQR
ncbi:SRPBCC family protein [Sinorhizobium numidicum]|uniref:SRPBCC family protein n=1 Tax=Sinorhizobium numidicum TaxID=680248 RepID=A0ABY8CX70_9HYPH|nr:SRPBCC family protein [Sinorhizobium numidicum]WEX76058.1 SRPBCC family protein [Sinorhizobium numidicum]WEX82717.1 SRPBCC family protein [Sinorhizobium numidicum]